MGGSVIAALHRERSQKDAGVKGGLHKEEDILKVVIEKLS